MTVLRTQADDADRSHEQRGGQAQAEEFERQIALPGAHEHAWDEPPPLECGDVRPLGVLAACAAGHLGADRGRHRRVGQWLQLVVGHGVGRRDPAKPVEIDLVLVVGECHDPSLSQ